MQTARSSTTPHERSAEQTRQCLGELLTNKANIQSNLYALYRKGKYLDKPLALATGSLALCTETDDARIVRLSNLATRYKDRYCTTKVYKHISQAMRLSEEAVISRTFDRGTKQLALHIYCCSLYQLLHRGDVTQDRRRKDLDRLIRLGKISLGLAGDNSSIAKCYYNVSNYGAFAYDSSQEESDLRMAIRYNLLYLRVSRWSSVDRLLYVSGLGHKLERMFERTDQIADIQSAIELHKVVLRLRPGDPSARDNLASACQRRSQSTGLEEHEGATALAYGCVLDSPSVTADRRIIAGGIALSFALIAGDRNRPYALLKKIENLLPSLHGHLQDIIVLQDVLKTLSGLPEQAILGCL